MSFIFIFLFRLKQWESDVSEAFGTPRNSETKVDKGDNSNSSTDPNPEIMNGTKVDKGDNSNSSTDSNPEYLSPVADAGTDITVQAIC